MLVSSNTMLCVITWIRVKKISAFVRLIFAYFYIRRKARTVPGFFGASILLKPRRTLMFVSLWENSKAFGHFNTAAPEHARLVTDLYQTGVETWSGAFELNTKSATSEPWNRVQVQAPLVVDNK